MDGLVREVQEERLAAIASVPEPLERLIGEDIGRVALERLALAVDVQCGIEVGSLPAKADPVVETRAAADRLSWPMCHLPTNAVW